MNPNASNPFATTTLPAHRDLATGPITAPWEPQPPEAVEAGTPTTRLTELGRLAGLEIGLWEITPGTVTDTEADEIFVVLSGAARLEFLSTDDAPIELQAGSLVRLAAGTRTRWIVTETLRKVYLS